VQNAYAFGADATDCFWNWLIAALSRRLLGLNDPRLPSDIDEAVEQGATRNDLENASTE
ncbi:unnamed protein product, partial [Amoebophrya sp. A120]